MSGIWSFFSMGFSHIVYTHVFSHILFIVVLCGIYTFDSRARVLAFLSLFFLGYLISFMMVTFGIIVVPETLLMLLMPLTIFSVAFSNYFLKRNEFMNRYPPQKFRYIMALAGGGIHGLAFPDSLKEFLISPSDLVPEIIFFNLGIMTAILLTSFFLLFTSFFLTYFIRMNLREWNLMLSGACAGISLYMLANFLSH